jgi:hypothetical protein
MKRLRLFCLLSVVCCLLSACIRLSGSAGYWKQGENDEVPKSKSVGFDTANLDPDYAPGSIET